MLSGKRATVVVLGDLGRSPRMSNHAYSLAQHGADVVLVGYDDSPVQKRIQKHERIRVVGIPSCPAAFAAVPLPLALLLKYLWSFVLLLFTLLFKTHRAHFLVLQNPPILPTSTVCNVVHMVFGTQTVVDFHNFSASMIEHAYHLNGRREDSIVLKFIRTYHRWTDYCEKRAANSSSLNLCVSKAMAVVMKKKFGADATVIYDLRTTESPLRLLSAEEKHAACERFAQDSQLRSVFADASEGNRFTVKDDGREKPDRPLLIVSSTSWTEDEDFGMLFDALVRYDDLGRGARKLPDLAVVITGKGKLKESYICLFRRRHWRHVTFAFPFVSPEDYPRVVACADLGVSLHTSTSGVDLPMKAVDMFSCGVPVLAKRFPAIDELVTPDVGCLFDDSADLFHHIERLAGGFRDADAELSGVKKAVAAAHADRTWEDQYERVLVPLIASLHY